MNQSNYDLSWLDQPSAPFITQPPQLPQPPLPDLSWAEESGDYTLGEYATQAGSSLLSGFTDVFTGAVKGVGILSEKITGESEIDDWAREMEQSVREFAPGVVGLGDSWTAKIAGGFGSAGGFVLAGAATGGAGAVAGRGLAGVGALGAGAGATAEAIAATGLAVGRGAQLTSAGALGALGNASSRYEEAKLLGKSDDEAWGSYLVGIPIGSLEALPIGLSRSAQRLGRINKASGDALKKLTVGQVMLGEGLEEAGQEMLNESLNQLADYALSIKTAEEAFDFKQVLESGVLGFIPGSAIGGLTAKAQIAADLAEQRKAIAEKEAAELPKKLEEQRIAAMTEQVEGATRQAKELSELYAAGEAELAKLESPAEVAPGEEPRTVGTAEDIAKFRKQLARVGEARDIAAKRLEDVTAEPDLERKVELAGDYGYARAAAELKGQSSEFEATQAPGAERILTPEESVAWDKKKAEWKARKTFGALPVNVDGIRIVMPVNDAQRNAETILNEVGVEVEYLDLGEETENVQGFEQSGKVYLNSRLSEANLLRTVARHEGYHAIYGKNNDQWQATLNKMQEVAPNVFAAAINKAASEIGARLGLDETKLQKQLSTPEGRAELTNETMSSMADIFGSTIDALRENPTLADELIQKDPGFFRRIWEYVKERLNKLGFKFETLSAKEQEALKKLPKLLYATTEGDVEVEASVNERIAGASTLISLWDRTQAETEVALSSRQRQARIFAKRTLGEIVARKEVEAKVKEAIDKEDAEAAAERKAKEEEAATKAAKKRSEAIKKITNKIKQVSSKDEEWSQIRAIGEATNADEQKAAAQIYFPSDATPAEQAQIVRAIAARYDQVASKEREAAAKKKAEAESAAAKLVERQEAARQAKEAKEQAKRQREEQAKVKAAEQAAERARKQAEQAAEKQRRAEERQRAAQERKNAAAEKLAQRQAEKTRKEAEKAQKEADSAAAKLAEQQRMEQEVAAAAEAAAQAAKEAEEARKRRKGEKIPKVRRGRIVPGQLRVGDIVTYQYHAAKVIEATGSGLEQRVRVQRLSPSESKYIQDLDRADWWNAVAFAGNVYTVDMTSLKLISMIVKRDDVEILREEGVKFLGKRIRADLERKEGEVPRFSVVGKYDDISVDERHARAAALVEAFKAGGETLSTDTWGAIHDFKSRDFDRAEWDKAIAYYEENGMWPYLEAGQYTIPVQVDVDVEPLMGEDDGDTYFSINLGKKGQAKDRRTGLPRNKNGTVTVYFPTTNENARNVVRNRELVGHSPDATRIYLTNESNGATVMKDKGNIEQPLDGANVLLHIDPAMLSVDETYENGRRDFFITIREGKAFRKKMKQIKLFALEASKDDKIAPDLKLKDLIDRFGSSVESFRKMKPDAQRKRLREAKAALKSKHNITTLLSENGKLRKTSEEEGLRTRDGKKLRSMGLGLSAAQQISDSIVACPNASHCWWLCLGDTSGGNELYGGEGSNRSGPRLSQYLKTEALALSPEDFAIVLYSEIEKFSAQVIRQRRAPSVRLNVTSDFTPMLWKPLHDAFPRVMFYDYTKTSAKPISRNHHITYSSTGWSQEVDGKYYTNERNNWNLMRIRLDEGYNVAVAFTAKKKEKLPETVTDSKTGKVYKVIDGDVYDARYLDTQPANKQGVIVGLRNKDETRTTGAEPMLADYKAQGRSLFVYYDRKVHGKNLTVPKQKDAKSVRKMGTAFSIRLEKPNLAVNFISPRTQESVEAWDAIAEYLENVSNDFDEFFAEDNLPLFDAEYLRIVAIDIYSAEKNKGIVIDPTVNKFIVERIDDIIDDARIDSPAGLKTLRNIQRRLSIEGYSDRTYQKPPDTLLSEWMKSEQRRKGEGGKSIRGLLEYMAQAPEYEQEGNEAPTASDKQLIEANKLRPLISELLAVNNKRLGNVVELEKGRASSTRDAKITLDPRSIERRYPSVVVHEVAHQLTQAAIYRHLGNRLENLGQRYYDQIDGRVKILESWASPGSSGHGTMRVGQAYLQAINAYAETWIAENQELIAKSTRAGTPYDLYLESVLGGIPDRALKAAGVSQFNYYLSNADEFVAGAMADPAFQKWLNTIPVEGEPETTLWQKFISAIAEILGISVDQQSLLAKVLSGVEEIAKTDDAKLEPVTETMFSVKPSVTPEMDAAYLDAVERGDLDTAQQMVDEAAKAVGLDKKVYRGDSDQTVNRYPRAKRREPGIFTTTNREEAGGYSGSKNKRPRQFFVGGRTLDLTLTDNATKQWLNAWAQEAGWDFVDRNTGETVTPIEALQTNRLWDWEGDMSGARWKDIQLTAKDQGYDIVLLPDAGLGNQPMESTVVLNENKLKLADPVTRDEDGRVIPLSERFNEEVDDIRFSALGSNFSAKGKGKGKKPSKPKRVSGKAAKEAVKASRSAAAQLAAAQERARKQRAKELPGIKTDIELAMLGGEGTDIGESPGTAIASGTEEGRAMIRALREQVRTLDTQVLPDLTTDDDAREEAVAKLADNYEGVKAKLYKEIDNTGAVSEPWKVYATMLIAAQEAEAAMTGRMTVAKYTAAYEAEQRDAIVKRAASASLRVRKDAVMSAAARNRAHIFAGTKAMRREIEKLRKAAESGNKAKRDKAERKIAKMRAAHAEAVVEAINGLSEEGYDVDELFSYLSGGDPITFSRIVRRLADARTLSDMREGYVTTFWDMVMEARMASLLSGPATHTANIAGNAAMVTLRTTRQLAEVLTNMVIRDRESADFGDFKAYMTGFLRSLGRAGRNLMMAYRTDMPVFEVQLSRETALEFSEKTNGIPGLIGRMLRLPSLTTLRAFDEFFKTVAAHTEVASLAYRDGRSRGMSGTALEHHIDRVLNDFNDPLWQEGLDEALKTVFQDKSDKLTRLLLSTRSFLDENPTTIPVGSYLLPFVKTPLQIFKVGLSMPIHPIIPIFRWVNRKRAGEEYTGKEKVTDSANALVSMALFVAAYSMLGDDDDDEARVTGAAPDQWEERMLGQRTAPAYSIKSSDGDWYTYGRIEPFATGFSAMVDGIRTQQRLMRDDIPDKWSQGMSIMFNNVMGQIEDKTFLRTVGDVAKMFRERDQINAAKFARDLFVTPMIPNLIRQTVGNTDPYIRNTTVREYEDKSTWESSMQSLSYVAYPDSERQDAPPMRYDLWGRPIKRPGDSAFARNFSPAQKVYDEDDIHKLDRLIVTFNDKVADGKFGEAVEKYLPRSPEYRLRRGENSYILNDEEYARYSKESGERAAKLLSRARLDYDDPDQRDIDKIKDALSRSRKLTVDRILRERRKLSTQP